MIKTYQIIYFTLPLKLEHICHMNQACYKCGKPNKNENKDGVIVDVKAEKGEKLLKDLIATDEGACRLGEVALVPDNAGRGHGDVVDGTIGVRQCL